MERTTPTGIQQPALPLSFSSRYGKPHLFNTGDPLTSFRSSTAAEILERHGPPRYLLSTSTKVEKSGEVSVLTPILYLTPGVFCPAATDGCRQSCLGHSSGKMGWKHATIARDQRSALFAEDRETFLYRLRKEIEGCQRRAKREGLQLAVRLNGTSDILWERQHPEIFADFPDIQFYDYTKMKHRVREFLAGYLRGSSNSAPWPSNYHVTYSAASPNEDEAQSLLSEGGTVATVFWPELPKTWLGFPVINGDLHDARFLDPKGSVVGLKAKGWACVDTDGFVVRTCPQCGDANDSQLTLVSCEENTHRETFHRCDACGYELRTRRILKETSGVASCHGSVGQKIQTSPRHKSSTTRISLETSA